MCLWLINRQNVVSCFSTSPFKAHLQLTFSFKVVQKRPSSVLIRFVEFVIDRATKFDTIINSYNIQEEVNNFTFSKVF